MPFRKSLGGITILVTLAIVVAIALVVAARGGIGRDDRAALEVTQAYYFQWIRERQERGEGYDPEVYRQSPYLSPRLVQAFDYARLRFSVAGHDPSVCTAELPSAWEVTDISARGDYAEALVTLRFYGEVGALRVPVILRESGGVWRLDEVRCHLATGVMPEGE